jgi:hypothetical protein
MELTRGSESCGALSKLRYKEARQNTIGFNVQLAP